MNKRYYLILTILFIFLFNFDYVNADKFNRISIADEIRGPFYSSEEFSKIQSKNLDFQINSIKDEPIAIEDEASIKRELHKELKNRKDIIKFTYIDYKVNTGKDLEALSERIKDILHEIYNEDGYIYGSMISIGWQTSLGSNNVIIITFTPTYYTNVEQEMYIQNEVKNINTSIINYDMNELEKAKAINDYVVSMSSYSATTQNSPHSTYTILTEGKGVCQAYALLTYLLCEEAGLDVKYLVGEAGSLGKYGAHAWNLVNLDAEWYHIDTTWNDPLPDRRGRISYSYFLMNDSKIKRDHIWEIENYPNCNSTKYYKYWDAADAVTYGDQIIYSNSSANRIIYKMSLDGDVINIFTNNRGIDLVISDYWIYFSNYSDGGYLYKIDKDGKNLTRLNRLHSTGLYVEDNVLYYMAGGQLKNLSVEIEDQWTSPFISNNFHPTNKTWEIAFNKEINSNSVSQETIFVARDKYGKDKVLGININIDNKSKNKVEIEPPINGWKANREYYLFVTTDVESINGEKISEGIRLSFLVN